MKPSLGDSKNPGSARGVMKFDSPHEKIKKRKLQKRAVSNCPDYKDVRSTLAVVTATSTSTAAAPSLVS